MTSMKGVKFKLKPLPKLPDVNDLVYRLRKRAEIRREIPGRKSVENGEPDRIADLLEEAADEIRDLRYCMGELDEIIDRLGIRLENCIKQKDVHEIKFK